MKSFKITALFLFIGMAGMAQTKKRLVADETILVELKASVKIETCNESIFQRTWSKFKGTNKRYTVELKTDRHGEYTQYTIPFKTEQLKEVETYLRSL